MTILGAVGSILCIILRWTIKKTLKFDRKVVKRYLHIETPLYRLWWEQHSANMQKKLDRDRAKRELATI